MYYGYNDKQQLVMADKEFIELLGYKTFDELRKIDIVNSLKLQNNKISIKQENQKISSHFLKHEINSNMGDFYLVELTNVSIHKLDFQGLGKLKTTYRAIYLDVEKISKNIGLTVEDYKLYLDSFIDQSIIDERRLIEGNDGVIKNLSNLALTLKIPHINILLLKIQKLSQRERMPLIDEYYTKLALLTLEKPEDYEDNEFPELLEDDTIISEKKEEVLNARFTDLLNNIAIDEEQEREEEKKKEKEVQLDKVEEKVAVQPEPFVDLSRETFLPENDDFLLDKEFNPTESTATLPVVEILAQESDHKIKSIQLDNVSALPISYDPQTAADELNLPVVLIEEFVEDFIEQARHDKDHLLTSYYQEDMDNIHELGHKLKGAASNLRINELADILEEIQFCTDIGKLEPLFVKYWGHFLSLEDYMNQLKKA